MIKMMMFRCFLAVALAASAVSVQADVFNLGGTTSGGTWTGLASLQFVSVGDPGNLPDPANGNIYGAVAYTYQMGKYDVTSAQYTAFLNAVAATDTYGLYNSNMASGFAACGISQSGSAGSYSYATTRNGNFPVNYETWGDAARFCNWLQNGQPTGAEGPGTTETGAYALNGGTSSAALSAVASPAHSGSGAAHYFLPTENEWYKAAYYARGGTAAGYWTYPTQSNVAPDDELVNAGTSTNDANYYGSYYTDVANFLTPVGTFVASPGAYGTSDMGGDLCQWNETNIGGSSRGARGGSFGFSSVYLASNNRSLDGPPTEEFSYLGFRVASSESVPEPGSIALLLAGAVGLLAFAWGRRTHAT